MPANEANLFARPSFWDDHCAFCSGRVGEDANADTRYLLTCEKCEVLAGRSQPLLNARHDSDFVKLVASSLGEYRHHLRHLNDRSLLFEHLLLVVDREPPLADYLLSEARAHHWGLIALARESFLLEQQLSKKYTARILH
jgi:hypothetical protein